MPTFQFYVNGQMVHSFAKADEAELRAWTTKLALQGSPPQSKPLHQDKPQGAKKQLQSVQSLTSIPSHSLQEELDRRLVVKQQNQDKEWAENPCLTNRKRFSGLTEKVVIIGGGPGGVAAAIYAARANLCPLVIAPSAGGQLLAKGVDIENYPGLPGASGADMIEIMRRQARSFAAEFKEDSVVKVNANVRPFEISTAKSEVPIKAHSVIIATGSEARWLGVPGEYEYRGHGVSGCATCDGFLFRGKECAVIGGGDTAMEEALVLSRTCSGVTLFHRRDAFRASHAMQQRVFSNSKITVRFNAEVTSFGGIEERIGARTVQKLTHLELQDTQRPHAKTSRFDVSAAFVAIGHTPNTKFMKEQVEMDAEGYLKLESGCTRTSVDGIFAAGDVADHVYQQAVTSCGSGAMAALDAEKYLIANLVEESCTHDNIASWKLKDLHSEVQNRGLACKGCYKKSDYVDILQLSC